MLVLTRRAGQALRVGDAIEIRIVRIEGDRVVLGLTAPGEVAILRAELLEEVSDEVRLAAEARAKVRALLRPPG